MEDFVVRRKNSEDGKLYMYIGFQDIRAEAKPLVNCFGSALIRPDDNSEYWFNYSFYHSLDWREVSEMMLRPMKNYKLTMEQIKKISNDIFYNIIEFISSMN